MRNLMLTLEYDGTDFCGWQSQAGTTAMASVQETVEKALAQVLNHPVTIMGAGRTDSGVHAVGQVAHLHTENPLPLQKIFRGVNSFIRGPVALRDLREVHPDFDARRSALSRRYIYRIWNSSAPSPLRRLRWLHVPHPLEHGAIAEAAAHFVGEHDFSAFRSSNCGAENPVRTVLGCQWSAEGPEAQLEVTAHAFLHSQIRIMVGTLLEVGRARRSIDSIPALLASGDRTHAGPTAAPHGLTLTEITYPENLLHPPNP